MKYLTPEQVLFIHYRLREEVRNELKKTADIYR